MIYKWPHNNKVVCVSKCFVSETTVNSFGSSESGEIDFNFRTYISIITPILHEV